MMTRILSIIGGITAVVLLILIVMGVYTRVTRATIPSKTILEIDFGKGLVEQTPFGFLGRMGREEVLVMRDVVSALEFAATDNRVKGLIARIDGAPFSYADVQEIGQAIKMFSESGKPAIAFAETFGEVQSGNSCYYLASFFDSVYLQPSGDLGLTGLLSQSPFFKDLLEKLDIQPLLGARKEYKTARNLFTETEFTDEHRDANQAIINSVLSTMVEDISVLRNISLQQLRKLVSDGPFSAQQALDVGLVDGLRYRDQVYNLISEKVAKDSKFLYINRYIERLRPGARRGPAVALIYAQGNIVRGPSRFNPLSGESVVGAQTVSAAIRAAVRDKQTEAIILRINSPGGSYVGSDIIWREVANAQKSGVPVIASMGAVAGSGGYFIAMNANQIVAQPSTITGSIGVVGGKFDLRGPFSTVGITFDDVATDPNAALWSTLHDYSDEHWEFIQSWLDTIYNDFINKVVQGRSLEKQTVEQIAKGRIYTGSEALELGLIDSTGGLSLAIEIAKEYLGVAAERPVRIKMFPRKKTLWEQVFARPPESSEDSGVDMSHIPAVSSLKVLKQLAQKLGVFSYQRGTLLMDEPFFQ